MLTAIVLVVALALALVLVAWPTVGLTKEGRAFAFVALFLLPLVAAALGIDRHVEQSKRTEFCTSCHVMDLHGRSLLVDDDTLLAATHYQGGRVPRETACFACHTTYTMYGDFNAKLRGVKHVWMNYFGGVTDETKIKLYAPYHNRECLHCHQDTRRFERAKTHRLDRTTMGKILKNETSCLTKGCHEFVHDVANIKDQPLWHPGAEP
jgi:nitrate/TMAO reductase-like tetraheme cytochrome c subunit